MNVYRYCHYICKRCFGNTKLSTIKSRPPSVRGASRQFCRIKGICAVRFCSSRYRTAIEATNLAAARTHRSALMLRSRSSLLAG